MDEQEQQNTVSSDDQEVSQVAPTPLSPPPSHKKLIIGIVAGILFAGAISAGAFFFMNQQSTLDEVVGWQTYDNISMGFSVKYPDEWTWGEANRYVEDLGAMAVALEPPGAEEFYSCTILFVRSTPTDRETGAVVSFRDLIAKEKERVVQLGNEYEVKGLVEKDVLLNKISSTNLSYFVQGGHVQRIFVPLATGETFGISYYSNKDSLYPDCESKFEQILSTFKFTE